MCALVALLSHLHDCANFLDEEYEEVADLFFTFRGKSSFCLHAVFVKSAHGPKTDLRML